MKQLMIAGLAVALFATVRVRAGETPAQMAARLASEQVPLSILPTNASNKTMTRAAASSPSLDMAMMAGMNNTKGVQSCLPPIKWMFNAPVNMVSGNAPMIASNGDLYLSCINHIGPNGIVAVNPNGTTKWTDVIPGVGAWITEGDDGSIYATTQFGMVALNPTNGYTNWFINGYVITTGQNRIAYDTSSCTLDTAGNLYLVNSALPTLDSYDPQGNLRFQMNVGDLVVTPGGKISVGIDGTLYAAFYSGLLAFDTAGNRKWFKPTTTGTLGQASVTRLTRTFPAPDWSIIVPSHQYSIVSNNGVEVDTITAYHANGNQRWQFSVSFTNAAFIGAFSTPLVGPNGTTYTVLQGLGIMYALNSTNGNLVWSNTVNSGNKNNDGYEMALSSDGTLYLSDMTFGMDSIWSLDGTLTAIPAFNNAGGAEWTGVALAPDGTVYICATPEVDGPPVQTTIYALSGCAGPACSAWPQSGRNNTRNSRMGSDATGWNGVARTNGFTVTVTGTNGTITDVCDCSNLTANPQWATLGQVKPSPQGTPFVDTSSSNAPMRFYRPKIQP